MVADHETPLAVARHYEPSEARRTVEAARERKGRMSEEALSKADEALREVERLGEQMDLEKHEVHADRYEHLNRELDHLKRCVKEGEKIMTGDGGWGGGIGGGLLGGLLGGALFGDLGGRRGRHEGGDGVAEAQVINAVNAGKDATVQQIQTLDSVLANSRGFSDLRNAVDRTAADGALGQRDLVEKFYQGEIKTLEKLDGIERRVEGRIEGLERKALEVRNHDLERQNTELKLTLSQRGQTDEIVGKLRRVLASDIGIALNAAGISTANIAAAVAEAIGGE